MWYEGSHSSYVYWFRAKLEWGKDYDHFFFGVAKVGSGNKGFSVDGFYVRGSTVHQTYPPTK